MIPTECASAKIECLVYSIYRETILPVFPVLSSLEVETLRTRFDDAEQHQHQPTLDELHLPPLIDLVLCTLAAHDRSIPHGVYEELLYALNTTLDGAEGLKMFTISTVGHVQTMLLLTMSQEMQGQATNHSGSVMYLRVGMTLRMAQDLVSTSQSCLIGLVMTDCDSIPGPPPGPFRE